MLAFDVGDLIEIRSYESAGDGFKDAAGTLTDPTTVTLKIEKPSGTETTYTYAAVQITRDSAGRFYKQITPAAGEHGVWHYRWIGTGAVTAATEGAFFVRESRF
jgi:hypothetical protein